MDKQDLLDSIQYIAGNNIKLKDKYIPENLQIDYLTVFSHSEDEFSEMKEVAQELGEVIDDNNGPIYKLFEPINIPTGQLDFFRVRHPDQERPQKGCGDFKIENYEEFKNKYLRFNENITLIKRPKYEMAEIKDKEFDVLVYFPNIRFSEELRKK